MMLRVIERNEMTFVTYYSSQLPQLPKSFEELDVFVTKRQFVRPKIPTILSSHLKKKQEETSLDRPLPTFALQPKFNTSVSHLPS